MEAFALQRDNYYTTTTILLLSIDIIIFEMRIWAVNPYYVQPFYCVAYKFYARAEIASSHRFSEVRVNQIQGWPNRYGI